MHVWEQLPLSLRSRVLPSSYVYPRYLRLAMGHSHSVHILMSTNITSAGRAFHASQLLLPKAQDACKYQQCIAQRCEQDHQQDVVAAKTLAQHEGILGTDCNDEG